jgi:hypothetical protein
LSPTGSFNCLLNIGGIGMTGYLNKFSFSLSPNQPIKASATYNIYHQITGNITGQNFSLLTGNSENTSGIGHYWFTQFLKTGIVVNSGQIIALNYSFDIDNIAKVSLGNIFPSQIETISAIENLDITHEQQINNIFSGKSFQNYFNYIDGIHLKPLYHDISKTFNVISFSGFILTESKFSIQPENLLLFNNSFKKYY